MCALVLSLIFPLYHNSIHTYRVAEELVFGQSKVTTGASGDLQQIFRIARAMVCQLGKFR